MARRKKEPAPELTPVQTRVKRAIIQEQANNEVIRDAFLEGRDKLAIEALREMDGRGHLHAAAKAIKVIKEELRNIPSTCYGAIPRMQQISERFGAARVHFDLLPDEWRRNSKGASTLFGLRNTVGKRIQAITEALKNNCTGESGFPGRALTNFDPNDAPMPYGDVPLEGAKARRKKRR